MTLIIALPALDELRRAWRDEIISLRQLELVTAPPLAGPLDMARLLTRTFLATTDALRCAYCGARTHAAAAQVTRVHGTTAEAIAEAPLTLIPICRPHARLWPLLTHGPEYTERFANSIV